MVELLCVGKGATDSLAEDAAGSHMVPKDAAGRVEAVEKLHIVVALQVDIPVAVDDSRLECRIESLPVGILVAVEKHSLDIREAVGGHNDTVAVVDHMAVVVDIQLDTLDDMPLD